MMLCYLCSLIYLVDLVVLDGFVLFFVLLITFSEFGLLFCDMVVV